MCDAFDMRLVHEALTQKLEVVVQGLLGVEAALFHQLLTGLRFLAAAHDLPPDLGVQHFLEEFGEDILIGEARDVFERAHAVLDLDEFVEQLLRRHLDCSFSFSVHGDEILFGQQAKVVQVEETTLLLICLLHEAE